MDVGWAMRWTQDGDRYRVDTGMDTGWAQDGDGHWNGCRKVTGSGEEPENGIWHLALRLSHSWISSGKCKFLLIWNLRFFSPLLLTAWRCPRTSCPTTTASSTCARWCSSSRPGSPSWRKPRLSTSTSWPSRWGQECQECARGARSVPGLPGLAGIGGLGHQNAEK